VQYDALQRVFVLPKPHSPYTLVVAALDPPIRKASFFPLHSCSVSVRRCSATTRFLPSALPHPAQGSWCMVSHAHQDGRVSWNATF